MAIWRIQTNTSKGDISDYCLKNSVAAVGWSLSEHMNRSELDGLTFSNYCELAEMYYDSFGSVTRLALEVKPNDIIWMRKDGVYYFARIKEESVWSFNNSEEALSYDACNQLSNIEWICMGDESDTPGALSTSFIRGSTLQRIYKPGVLEFSELMYDIKSNDGFKYNRTIELNEDTFYSLISPSDCEDLLYIFTYFSSNKNYVCVPSTNKLSTQKYEFVALDAETGKHIYYQVKNGDVPLNADDYYGLIKSTENEVYLLTTRGKVSNDKKYPSIHTVDPTALFEFCCNEENFNIIPPNIKYWMEFAGGYNPVSGNKGIMFDTNSDESESYMFSNNVVAAWGPPKRYIDSFIKGDYVFFYKKWFGIIAVGEIVSDDPILIEEGKEHKVRMIIEPRRTEVGNYASIRPHEIKEVLNKSFYFASTRKVPFLNKKECETLTALLNKKVIE